MQVRHLGRNGKELYQPNVNAWLIISISLMVLSKESVS